jgi:flavorubredoxin
MNEVSPQSAGTSLQPVSKRPMPREIGSGVWWLGDCLGQLYNGKTYHGCNAAHMVVGTKAALLSDTGHPKDFPVIAKHIEHVLARNPDVPLKYLFLTHQETPHSGGLGRLLARFPELEVVGDVSDYHLAFPQYEHRMRFLGEGEAVDLGGREFKIVEPVVRDLRTSNWGFDTKTRCLFPGDGFAYSHYHWDGHCGMVAEEATSLDLVEVCAVFQERALYWTTFVDMERYVERMEWQMKEFGVRLVAPSHGLPVTDLERTWPEIRKGLLAGEGTFDDMVKAAPGVAARAR